jgi:hypothetical protein
MIDSNNATLKKRRGGQRLNAQQKKAIQETFLESFAQNANVTVACRKAGIDRSTVYRWKEHDETFSFRYNQAEVEANDVIRAAIFKRAIIGVEKPLHFQGRVVTDEHNQPMTVTEYSDTLLIFLAKARMPEFREKQQIDITTHPDVSGAKELLMQRLARLEGSEA